LNVTCLTASFEKLNAWSNHLCRLEENDKIVLTPFEKNIDIWRQLWRVVERSDLVSNAPPSPPLSPTDIVIDCLFTVLCKYHLLAQCFGAGPTIALLSKIVADAGFYIMYSYCLSSIRYTTILCSIVLHYRLLKDKQLIINSMHKY
jgi:hypothetical protein